MIFVALLISLSASAQTFDTYFEDATLRLDYIFAGNDHEQRRRKEQIFFHVLQVCEELDDAGEAFRLVPFDFVAFLPGFPLGFAVLGDK